MEKLYYRYRAFTNLNIESLCNDEIFFAKPDSFNDPLDCSFVIECDSLDINEIRNLFSVLFTKRRETEILLNLKNAKVSENKAREFAIKRTEFERLNKLEEIAYLATDPEYLPLTEEQVEILFLQSHIADEISKHYAKGVVCFSSSYKSPVLWSHYGDEHRGFCIGYSTKRDPSPEMHRVIYGNSRSINMSTLIAAYLYEDKKAQSDLDRDILLRKAKEWKYEKELRLIDKQGKQDSPLLLTEITFGLRCSDVVSHTIIKALEGRNPEVNFYQIQIIPNSNILKREKFYNNQCGDNFPKTAKSAVETFGSCFSYTEI